MGTMGMAAWVVELEGAKGLCEDPCVTGMGSV